MTDPGSQPFLVHVVDDDEGVRQSLEFLLRVAGHRVQCWPDGKEFLEGADGSEPACVLLDIRMPGLNGMEVQQRMRQAGLDFPVILLTGHGDDELSVKAMKAGAIAFLVKPFERGKLLASIGQAFAMLSDRRAVEDYADFARAQLAKLTDRERQVLNGLACGYPNKAIAGDLRMTPQTVEVCRANLMTKLDAGNLADALRVAFAGGLGSEERWQANHGAGSQAERRFPEPAGSARLDRGQ